MFTAKTVAGSALIWGLLGTFSYAEPVIVNGGSNPWNWTVWLSSVRQNASHFARSDTSATSHSEAVSSTTPNNNPTSQAAAPVMGSTLSYSTPTPVPTSTASINNSTGNADAFINFGSGPFPEASLLTTGGSQPWYMSPAVEKFFGGQQPNSQQQAAFENAVLQEVQSTFQKSGGLNPSLTIDPSVPANHTLSVVSNTSYGANPNAIGITEVGRNGFSFIDKLEAAQTLNGLEWAVAHNVSHELMHAFGVASHYDQTGQYLDSATASWPLLIDPNTTFSSMAIEAMHTTDFMPESVGDLSLGQQEVDGDLEIVADRVPEPTTCLLWGMLTIITAGVRCRSRRVKVRR